MLKSLRRSAAADGLQTFGNVEKRDVLHQVNFLSITSIKMCLYIRVVQKTPTLEIQSRSSGFPWFQTRWVQWCMKKSILSTFRGRKNYLKFLKMYWRYKKQNANIISNRRLNMQNNEMIPNMASEFKSEIFDPFFGQKPVKNWQNTRLTHVWQFFGRLGGQMLSELNSEARFGILS